jgi:serine protease inhibitor
LQKLELKNGFDPEKADFSGISPQPMHISDILQNIRIEVRLFLFIL